MENVTITKTHSALTAATANVAATIREHLGGVRFEVMTNAQHFLGRPDGLDFRLGRNPSGVSHVRVTLVADLYDVEFLSIRGASRKTKAVRRRVYADNLTAIIEAETGLRTSLGRTL